MTPGQLLSQLLEMMQVRLATLRDSEIDQNIVHGMVSGVAAFTVMVIVTIASWCTTPENLMVKQKPRVISWMRVFVSISTASIIGYKFGFNIGIVSAAIIGSQPLLSDANSQNASNIKSVKKANGVTRNGDAKNSSLSNNSVEAVMESARKLRKPLHLRRPYVFPSLGEKDEKMGGKTVVMFSCMINDILEVNLIDEVFKPDMAVLMDWIDDENLNETNDGHKKDPYSEDDAGGFRPYMQFGNMTESAEPVEKNLGVWKMRNRPVFCRYARYIPEIRQRMSLQDFPFDVINLDTEIQFGWTYKDLDVIPAEMEIDPKLQEMNEYVLVSNELIVQPHLYEYYTAYEDSEDPYPEIIIRLTLARNPWYYIMRLVMPQILLSIMELTSFLCDSDAIADRFSISGTIVLSEIALYFIAVDMLPKVPYVTRIDIWFSWCFLLVFASCAQNGVNYILHGSVNTEFLAKVDAVSAVAYMVGVTFVTVWFMLPLTRFTRFQQAAQQRNAVRK